MLAYSVLSQDLKRKKIFAAQSALPKKKGTNGDYGKKYIIKCIFSRDVQIRFFCLRGI